jgi:Asp-tRNA(Asn)/Glu-tRNA(Gln) amidotransferase A subunit family amidase
MKRLRTALWIVLAGLLAGCSNNFVYNQLDWLIPWYVDDYVDLSRDQKKLLKQELEPLLSWHRGEELGRYIELIDRVEADLRDSLEAANIAAWLDEAVDAWSRIEERMLPLAFAVGDELTEAQMQEFIDTLWRRQADLEEEFLPRSDEEYLAENYQNFEDNLRDFLGRLTPAQEQTLRDAAAGMIRFDGVWLAERRAWLEQLQGLLQARQPGWGEAVRAALRAQQQNHSADYLQAYEHNQGVINGAVAAVLNQRTEQQSRHLQQELDDLRRDLRKLIARGD